jgi:hypothetical protein
MKEEVQQGLEQYNKSRNDWGTVTQQVWCGSPEEHVGLCLSLS